MTNTWLNSYKSLYKTFFLALLVICLCLGVLIFPKASSYGASTGLSFCGEILIPSLFPFMVISAFTVKSGLASKLGRFFNPITKLLFNLPGAAATTILISFIGGYPVGIRGVKALLEQEEISENQCNRMLRFTVGAGPAFVISVIGSKLFNSSKIGIIMFFSQVIASIIIGVVSGIFSSERTVCNNNCTKQKESHDIPSALVLSCADSTFGMINMCSFVILFSALLSIIKESGIGLILTNFLLKLGFSKAISYSILPLMFEITGGCIDASEHQASPELVAFAVAFAGFCVHFQMFAALNNVSFSKLKFILFRFIHGILSALIVHIAFMVFHITNLAFSVQHNDLTISTASNTSGSISLIFLCAFFLFTLIPKYVDFNNKKC